MIFAAIIQVRLSQESIIFKAQWSNIQIQMDKVLLFVTGSEKRSRKDFHKSKTPSLDAHIFHLYSTVLAVMVFNLVTCLTKRVLTNINSDLASALVIRCLSL